MTMASSDDRLKVNITARFEGDTPIFDALSKDWTQFYADDVLRRRLDNELLDNAEPTLAEDTHEEENDDADGRDDAAGAPGTGGGVPGEDGEERLEAPSQGE